MEEESKKITKIVINTEDELTDIVTSILESPNERIVLTFAEDSDLLISPINLKVIQETADEQGKYLIVQIIKNPTGVRNANLAGITAIETTALPTEDIWEREIEKRAERLTKEKPVKVEKKESTSKDDGEQGKGLIMIDEDIPRNSIKVMAVIAGADIPYLSDIVGNNTNKKENLDLDIEKI